MYQDEFECGYWTATQGESSHLFVHFWNRIVDMPLSFVQKDEKFFFRWHCSTNMSSFTCPNNSQISMVLWRHDFLTTFHPRSSLQMNFGQTLRDRIHKISAK